MNKQQQAMHMYLNESCTQQHIAATIGVSIRTIYSWIRQNSWDRLKQASLAAPAIIADNMCSQLLAMQQAISAREPAQRFPTMQEAEIARKLVGCIDKLKRYPSLTQSMQVLETFRQYVKAGSERDSWPIERWMGNFLRSKAKGGFRPNDIEYYAEKLSPFGLPFEEEEEVDDIATPTSPEPNTEDFSGQPEIIAQLTLQEIENQLNKVSASPVERQPDRQQSEVKRPKKGLKFGRRAAGKNTRSHKPSTHNSSFNTNPSNAYPIPGNAGVSLVERSTGNVALNPVEGRHLILSPTDFNMEELVDQLTADGLQGQNISPEAAAAYRRSLKLVMEGNLLNYQEELQSEIIPENTPLSPENQHTASTSDSNKSRQQSEV